MVRASQFALTSPRQPSPGTSSVRLAVVVWLCWIILCTSSIAVIAWLALDEQKPNVLVVITAAVLLAVLSTILFATQPLRRLQRLLHGYANELEIDISQLERADMVYEQVELLLQQLTWERRRSETVLASAGPVLTCGLDYRIISANRAAERLFGVRNREMIGQAISHFIPCWNEQIQRLPLGSSSEFIRLGGSQVEARHSSGRTIPIEAYVKLVFFVNGSILVVTVTDVSTSRQLSELQRLHTLTFAGVSDAIVLTDQSGKIIGWNPAAEQMFGYTEAEAMGKPVTLLHGADPPADIAPQLLDRLQREGRWNIEFRFKRKDGTEGICETVIAPLLDERGQRVAVLRVHRDVTQRKRAEEQIRLLQSVVAQASDAVIITDVETIDEPGPTILYVNDAFCRITGYSASEVLGRSPRFLQGPKTDPAARLAIRRAMSQWQPICVELINYRKDGTPFWAELNIAPVTHSSGFVTHWVAIQRDITERKRAEEQLLIAKEAAEAANRSKSDFLASVSHEIRTPMNGILGLTQLLLQAPLDATSREYVSLIKNSAMTLRSLIDDILDFSKVEAGQLRVDARPFSLRQCVRDAVEPLFTGADKQNLKTLCVIWPDVPDQLVGDSDRLRQVLINLVGNAIKFTERGYVQVECRQESVTAETVRLHFTVQDTGIGIAADQLTAIFRPFEQATPTTTRRYGGTGLGLAICERLVRLMGGEIGVQSRLGEGSLFWFSLVLQRVAVASPVAQSASTLTVNPGGSTHNAERTGSRFTGQVLIVEDNPVNQLVLSRLLNCFGLQPQIASHGVEALKLVEQQRYDLILMDIQMPDMDGYQVTARIRQLEQQGGIARQPIVAITAYARSEDREACLQAGMDDYLSKPIEQDRLTAVLLHWLSPQTSAVDPESSAPSTIPDDAILPTASASQIFQPAEALKQLAGDSDLLREIVQIFLRDAPSCLAELDEAVRQRDHASMRKQAHRFKTLAGYLSADLRNQADRLQNWTCDNGWTDPEQWLTQLRADTLQLQEQIRRWLDYSSNIANASARRLL